MNKNAIRLSFAIASLCAFASTSWAENLITQAPVPFAFSAAGHEMPAGQYTVTRLTENSPVLLILEETTGARALLLVRSSLIPAKDRPTSSLMFSTAESAPMLSGVEIPGQMFELSALPSKSAVSKLERPEKAVAALRIK